MISFLRDWIQGIAITVIIASIFEMLLPNGNLKKYIKIVLGIYIVFSIISPFVNKKELYEFDISKEVEKYSEVPQKTQIDIQNNFEEMYLDKLEEKIATVVEERGYNVRSCLVDTNFSGNEESVGINKIYIVVSSKKNKIEPVEKININVSKTQQNEIANEETITSEEMENVKKQVAEYLEISEELIDIKNY